MNIILPIAGKSSRFPNMRPKWMLTHPNGNFMLTESIKPFLQKEDRLIILYLQEHEKRYSFAEGLLRNLDHSNTTMIGLEKETIDQVETVSQAMGFLNEGEPFLVKDCDNTFSFNRPFEEKKNLVLYATLDKTKNSDPTSKSYVDFDHFGKVSNIVEKRVIGNKFCCGGYFFRSSKEFLNAYNNKPKNKVWFISDLIYAMMLQSIDFYALEVNGYNDWGTLDAWNEYKDSFSTLFVDLDGVLFENSSAYLKPYIGETQAIEENVSFIKGLDNVELVITTSRPESYREITEKQLKENNIQYKALIMGLQHNKRVIINDFSNTNRYPSCSAINIKRNASNLEEYYE